jgi:hypothetical protein
MVLKENEHYVGLLHFREVNLSMEPPVLKKNSGHVNSEILRAVKLKCGGVTTVLRPVVQFPFTNSNASFDDDVLKERSMNHEDGNQNTMPYSHDKLLTQV